MHLTTEQLITWLALLPTTIAIATLGSYALQTVEMSNMLKKETALILSTLNHSILESVKYGFSRRKLHVHSWATVRCFQRTVVVEARLQSPLGLELEQRATLSTPVSCRIACQQSLHNTIEITSRYLIEKKLVVIEIVQCEP
ncbi:hypothetical protein DRN94_001080 [archaeon]|nr:hypothetical protein [archaeon]